MGHHHDASGGGGKPLRQLGNDILKWLRSLSPNSRQIVNWAVTVLSVVMCLLALPLRLPGMELLGVSPDWLLIWVVAWSVKRSFWQGALAGIILGLAQDGMTMVQPTHVWSLIVVGMLTARLQKQRFIQEDFISVALIVFAMAVVAETLMAIQFSFGGLGLLHGGIYPELAEVWQYHQQVALASAILSSLWAPVLYYPLNRWWELMNSLEQIPSR